MFSSSAAACCLNTISFSPTSLVGLEAGLIGSWFKLGDSLALQGIVVKSSDVLDEIVRCKTLVLSTASADKLDGGLAAVSFLIQRMPIELTAVILVPASHNMEALISPLKLPDRLYARIAAPGSAFA